MLKPIAQFLGAFAFVAASALFAVGAPQPTERVIVVGDRTRGLTEIPYSTGLTASKAIITAGGYSDFSRTPIFIVRCGQLIRVDMRAFLERGQQNQDMQLRPWDVIVVGLGVSRRQ